jgi:hypothetical protein
MARGYSSESVGVGTESAIYNQLRKAQGETNDRLDALIAAQEVTNQLLKQLVALLWRHDALIAAQEVTNHLLEQMVALLWRPGAAPTHR